MRTFKSPGADKELDSKRIYRTTSKWYKDILDVLESKDVVMAILGTTALASFVFYQYFEALRLVFLVIAIGFFFTNMRIKLPLKIPAYVDVIDYNDPLPTRKKYSKAAGFVYIGNDVNGYELWLRDTDIKTHMLVYGTTGSGKTVTLQSLAYNAFVMGTGLTYIDPKGDAKLAHELYAMCRRLSREDDFLALDFATGGKQQEKQTPFRMSNTTNPFASASADAIINLISSLLPPADGNAVFHQKALTLLNALIPVLVGLRDANQALPLTDDGVPGKERYSIGSGMDITTIRDYMDITACAHLVYPPATASAGPRGNHMPGNQPAPKKECECELVAKIVDESVLDVMKAALSSLNFNPKAGPPEKQQSFTEQFGYAKGYFGQTLSSISGMYGHLFNVSTGEVDMYDCLFNRRVLVGILPSLEKSPAECENLGKIILASVKNSVSGGLGDKLEGKTKEVTGSLPSAANTPGIIVVDEYAAIMMPGFEIILTQARSLGFMAIIASQDYGGMEGKDAKSCKQIIENTKFKAFMTMASAKETWDLAKSLFGDISVEEVDLKNPEDRGTIRNISKVQPYDLMSQIEGEFHGFYKGDLIRGATPYMIPKIGDNYTFRLNRFVRSNVVEARILEDVMPTTRKISYNRRAAMEWRNAIMQKLEWHIAMFEPSEEELAA